MRLLFLSQGRKHEDHPGHHDALNRLVRGGEIQSFHNLPYIGFAERNGYDALWDEIVRLAQETEVDAVYFQYFHRKQNPSPRRCIEKLRKLPSHPVIVVSCGDSYSGNWMWPHFPKSFRHCACMSDIVFLTQMGRVADKIAGWGAKNIALLPNGLCQVRFPVDDSLCPNDATGQKDADLVWIGSYRKVRPNILGRTFWNGQRRRKIVTQLAAHFGKRFALYGHNWDGNPSWRGPIPFDEQQQFMRRGKVFIDALPDPFGERYYTSNRALFSLGSGVPVILFEKPGLDRLFRRDEHAYFAKHAGDATARCEHLLRSNPEVLQERALETARYIGEKHTQYHRMRFAVETICRYRSAKLDGQAAPLPKFPFFLPEVDLNAETQHAVRAWVG